MFMPSLFTDSVFDDFMNDFGFRAPRKISVQAPVMRTDVKETETNYELEIDLPGYTKDDVKAELKDGCLTITAEKNEEHEEKTGKYIRKERYTGSMSRAFYIGEGITEQDISAKFENGILLITMPKEAPQKVEEKKFIPIAG